jgi:hypothetical protein
MADPTLSISSENVCFLIATAREFDVQDLETDIDSEADSGDDRKVATLEAAADNPTFREIRDFVETLSDEEQIDLVALMWLGRDEATLEDWNELRAEAAAQHNKRTVDQLMGEPLVADYLEEGLSQFGFSCAEFASGGQ